MESVNLDQQERILQAIQAKRWSTVDEIWLEVIETESFSLDFHGPIIDKLVRRQQPQHFVDLYQGLLDAMLAKGKGEPAIAIIEEILAQNESHDFLRHHYQQAVKVAYTEVLGALLPDFMERAGFGDPAVPLAKINQRFNDLLGATKGQVFKHSMWGIGVVRDLNMAEGKVTIDFPGKKGQVMTLDGVRNFLRPIHKDHLIARMTLDADALKEMIVGKPAEVLRIALKGEKGRMKAVDLKRVLTARFLTENEYKSFWERARKAIKLDPWIEQVGTGIHAELVLRDAPRSFFDDIFANFLKAKDSAARRDVLRDVRRHGSDAEMKPDDVEALYLLFQKAVSDAKLSSRDDQFRLGVLFLEYSDLFEGKANPVSVDTLLTGPDVVELIAGLEVPDSRRIVLEHVEKVRPDDWSDVFVQSTIHLDSRTASWMEKELIGRKLEGERLAAIETIFAKPDQNPELFVWAAKNVLDGTWPHLRESLPPMMIIEELLSVLAELEEKFESRNLAEGVAAKNSATKVRALLNESNSKLFKLAVVASTVEEGRRTLHAIRLHNALSHQLKRSLEDILVDRHIELRQTSRMEEDEERKKPSHHYALSASLDEKRSHLSQLISHDIPAMAKVIETARELGDLKENAEYHAAKDRQKLLMQQAAELEDLIARARVVELKGSQPEASGFGTRIRLRETSNSAEREMTLMGMWEADLENNIISYLTPFGSQLMGRRVGETFVAVTPDGRETEYEVLGLASAMLAEGPGN